MAGVAQVYPKSLNKLCLSHIMENIRKHGRGLEEGVLTEVLRHFRAAAHMQTEE